MQTEIDKFYVDIFRQNLFLPAKTIFASPVFTTEKTVFSTVWQKPANPDINCLRVVAYSNCPQRRAIYCLR